jgi:arabinose-5-phosphate isomerase
MPLAPATAKMTEALVVMTEKSFGCLGVLDSEGRLVGIVTDGDLRRHMGPQLLDAMVGEIMTKAPRTIAPTMLASAALALMNSEERPITSLFVEDDGKPVGILHIHDLLRVGVA